MIVERAVIDYFKDIRFCNWRPRLCRGAMAGLFLRDGSQRAITMRNIFYTLACLIVLLASPLASRTALADAPAAANPPKENPAFKQLTDAGGRIEFLGNDLGVDGWIVLDKVGKYQAVLYTTPSGAIVQGTLFGQDGKALTPGQIAAFKARSNGSQSAVPGAEKGFGSKAEQLYALLEHAHWVRLGAANAPYLYLVLNPACPHCQDLWKKLQPAVKAGTLQVRIVPFGSDPVNVGPGNALLSVDNPAEAWQGYVEGTPGALGKDKEKPAGAEKFKDNTLLCKRWIQTKMPFVMYRKLADGTLNAIVGEPENVMLVQADLMKSN